MNWIRSTFPPSSYLGNVINEMKAELRFYEADELDYETAGLDELTARIYDQGWFANVRATIERLEDVQEEIRSMEG